jgi:hypothetical protein
MNFKLRKFHEPDDPKGIFQNHRYEIISPSSLLQWGQSTYKDSACCFDFVERGQAFQHELTAIFAQLTNPQAPRSAGHSTECHQFKAGFPLPLADRFGSRFVFTWIVTAFPFEGEYATKSTPESVVMGADSTPRNSNLYCVSISPHLPICVVPIFCSGLGISAA